MYQTTNIHLTPDLIMSEIIIENPYLILLLEHFGLDSSLQNKSIQAICNETEINTELFITFANLYNGNQQNSSSSFSFSNVTTVIEYLKNSHQYYSKEIYPSILSTIKKMAEVNNHKEMAMVEKFFYDYYTEVKEHLEYEDNFVFPYVLGLYSQIEDSDYKPENTSYSVKEYKDHHNDIEEKLNDLKNLLIKYLPYKNDHSIRRKLLFKLFELEYDLNIHSKIEDTLLIPLVAKMEEYISNGDNK